MPVQSIYKFVGGKRVQEVERCTRDVHKGKYVCLAAGMNMGGIPFDTLDEVAIYLRNNPRSGVRMNPGWSKVSEDILIDGKPR